MKRDKSLITKGMKLYGGIFAGQMIVKSADPPPKYGQPSKPTSPSFKQISEQLDAAKRRLEEIARQVRDARRR